LSQLGQYQLGYIETLSHWNQNLSQVMKKYLTLYKNNVK